MADDLVVTLPSKEDLLKRLIAFDSSHHLELGLYPLLLQRMGQEISPNGLVLATITAITEYAEGYHPSVQIGLELRMNGLIDALTDDPQARERAKEIWLQIQAKTESRRESKSVDQEAVDKSALLDRETYRAARRFVETLYECVATLKKSGRDITLYPDYRKPAKREPNGYHRQTTQGLYLDLSYGPRELWTPWGKWSFPGVWGSTYPAEKELEKMLLEKIDTHLAWPKSEYQADGRPAPFGPVYELRKVGEHVLPEAVLRPDRYVSPDETARAWNQLTKEFEADRRKLARTPRKKRASSTKTAKTTSSKQKKQR